ncbi:MAG: recombination protein RecA, partial [Oleiphilaceae bacterium]
PVIASEINTTLRAMLLNGGANASDSKTESDENIDLETGEVF